MNTKILYLMKMKNHLLSLAVWLLTLQIALAQRVVTGTVTGQDNNEPLVGASIILSGTTIGTTADAEGKFSISVPENATTLKVSFIGYTTKEVLITGLNNIKVSLSSGGTLGEVVVVGYTSQRKEDLTGSVAVVELKPVKNNIKPVKTVKNFKMIKNFYNKTCYYI